MPGPPGESCVEEFGFQLCRGSQGERGESCVEAMGLALCRGPSGEVSTTPGPAGASCVEEFGFEECQGPAGEASDIPGPPGPSCVEEFGLEACRGDTGPEGRGLTGTPEILVNDAGECVLRFFYTDDTTTDTLLPDRFCKPPLVEVQ